MATKLYSPGRINLKVKSAAIAPTSATPGSNGDIIVITDYPIAGYTIFPFESPLYVDGQLCIIYNTLQINSLNIASADGVYVSPVGCRQYIDGKSYSVDAYIYHGNSWVQFSYTETYLFKSGIGETLPIYTGHDVNSNVIIQTDKIISYANITNSGAFINSILSREKIDITGYSKLYADMSVASLPNNQHDMCLLITSNFEISDPQLAQPKYYAPAKTVLTVSQRKIFELDISALAGSYYVGLGGCANAEIYNLWMV